jgi:hypothetical protein
VKKSFLKTGISNALDGTEDDRLWTEPGDMTNAEGVRAFEAADDSEDASDGEDITDEQRVRAFD